MSRLAILRGGLVESVIAAPPPDDPWQPPDGTTVVPCPNQVGPGWRYDSGGWIAPPPAPLQPPSRVWTALEFDLRVEAIAPGAWLRLETAAVNPEIPEEARAQLRAAVRQSAKAQEIVASDPRTLAFLDAAVAFGVLTEEARTRILTDP